MIHIEFKINYQTQWEEQLYLLGSISELGNSINQNAVLLQHNGNGNWSTSIELEGDHIQFEYAYLVKKHNKVVVEEWGKPHHFSSSELDKSYRLEDLWQGMPMNKPFFSSAFTECLFARQNEKSTKTKVFKQNMTFQLFAPTVAPHLSVAISGNCPELGNWDPNKVLKLDATLFPEWNISINGAKLPSKIEYKFALVDNSTDKIIAWEYGENRNYLFGKLNKNESIILSGLHFKNPMAGWKGAGVAIPVFSLRSADSFGIGDFNDIKKLTDWAVATKQQLIQILPINDTTMNGTWQDSYPYNANSTYALHPVYLNPKKIGLLKDAKRMEYYNEKAQQLNKLVEVDYETVTNVKWEYFREIFKQNWAKETTTASYKNFFEANKEWLIPYSAFCFLRDKYKTPDFRLWKTHSTFKKTQIEMLCSPDSEAYSEIALHIFLQYQLHIQMRESVDYAHRYQVIIKGDIPIGISRTSVEAWVEPHYFNLDGQAGAPPDDFSVKGQNWGFPTYNWTEMEKDGYSWWKRRFKKMADYFDAYRIDHVLGFFRIWEIPSDAVHGLLGHFAPAMPFSANDIENFGLYFNEQRLAKPYIHEYMLSQIFGEHTPEVLGQFLNQKSASEFELRTEYNTQQKIQHCFNGKSDPKSEQLREGLYSLVSEVLFIADPKEPNKYHPRISAHQTFSYNALNDYEKNCFNKLYDHFFYHRHNEFWYHQSMQKLPAIISATSMLVCAEDLGMIPSCVPAVMNQLQILSLEIQRMPKDDTIEFGQTENYPYLSVATTSTHDMSTVRGWWEENRDKTQRYFNQILGQAGAATFYCETSICNSILWNHLWSPSMLVVLPLQDWLSIDQEIRRANPEDERINIPSNPRHYWRYRMHLSLEELISNTPLNEKIRTMIEQTGR